MFIKFKNVCINVVKILILLVLIIKLLERIFISKEIIMFLVINVSIIVINGGIKVKILNFFVLVSVIVFIFFFVKIIIVDIMNMIVVRKIILIFLFFI